MIRFGRCDSARSAVQRACPYMPTSLAEWAGLDADAVRRRGCGGAGVECDVKEALALRVLWEVSTKKSTSRCLAFLRRRWRCGDVSDKV